MLWLQISLIPDALNLCSWSFALSEDFVSVKVADAFETCFYWRAHFERFYSGLVFKKEYYKDVYVRDLP
jgi:hypothetical protein